MDKGECNPSSCNLGNDGRVIRDRVELRSRSQAAFLLLGRTSACLVLADTVAEVENRTAPKNLAKVDLWTSLLQRRFSTPRRRSVIDFG